MYANCEHKCRLQNTVINNDMIMYYEAISMDNIAKSVQRYIICIIMIQKIYNVCVHVSSMCVYSIAQPVYTSTCSGYSLISIHAAL